MDPRLTLATALLLVAPAFASAETRAPYGGKAVGSLTSAPTTIDPLAAQSWAEISFAALVFDNLYRLDAQGRLIPALAEGMPSLSADQLEARVTIRRDVRFQDGRVVDPLDVLASLRRASETWALAPVRSIEHDGAHLVFKLKRPLPAAELASLLAVPQLAITEGGRAPNPRAPIGSGPFRVRKLAYDTRTIELEAYPEYFAGRPYLDKVTLRWFEDPESEPSEYDAGKADLSLRGAVAFANREPKYPTDVLDGPATLLAFLGLGKAHPELLADMDFRRALSLAVSRAALRHVGTGERVIPALAPDSPDLGGLTPSPSDAEAHADLAGAALQRAAGRRPELRAGSGLKLELIVDRSRPDDTDVANRMVAAFDRVGLAVSFTPLAPADFARRVAEGKCDLYVGQLVAPTGERVHEYAAAFAAGGDGWLATHFAEGMISPESADKAFAARLPIIPLYHRAVRVHHKKTLLGLSFDPLGRLGLADAFGFVPLEGIAEEQP